MAGRPPVPTAIKVLNGNPGRRPLPVNEPNPEPMLRAHMPEHIASDPIAAREWKRLSDILRRMRVLTEADYVELANLCSTYSTMVEAQTKLRETGLIIVGKHGYQANPLVRIVNTCVETINKICKEFGLTPSARVRLAAGKKAEEDEPDTLDGNWKAS